MLGAMVTPRRLFGARTGADVGVTASGMFEAGIGETRVRGRVFFI